MAKIDISKIDGYEDMTLEEKIVALEAYDEEPNHDGYIKKKLFDKTASELAEAKRQLKAKMTEDEIAKQKEAEERAELEAKYNTLLRENSISKYKAKLLGMGYDDELADSTAEAMVDGNSDKIFDNQQKHLASMEKKLKADILKNTPKPKGDGESNTMTLEGFRKLSPAERYEFSKTNPEEYKALYEETGGNE